MSDFDLRYSCYMYIQFITCEVAASYQRFEQWLAFFKSFFYMMN
jgi:hypothetical protein